MGVIRKEGSHGHEEGIELGRNAKTQTEEKPGLPTRKWTMFDRDSEPREPEYLAKRRKGLHSLYGGSTAPINTSGQMRKIKIRNVDSEGNSQIVEALVPEGQAVDAEIVEEELTTPTQALAPGTRVEGVGIANAEGVLVPEEQVTPAAQRRRPPPPKRRLKGPGRGRKKKVAFASGTNVSTAPGDMQAAVGDATKPSDGDAEAVNGVQSIECDNEGEDSVMHDASQDGEEGSEEGSEGEEAEEADREEGEVSASPEAPVEPSKPLTLANEEPQEKPLTDTGATTVPAVTATEEKLEDDVTPSEQQPPKPEEEPPPQHMDESPDGPLDETTEVDTVKGPAREIELQTGMASSAPMAPGIQETNAHATPPLLPSNPKETMNEPVAISAPSSPPSVARRDGEMKASSISDTPPQASIQTAEAQPELPSVMQLPSGLAGLPPKPPAISFPPDLEPTTQDQSPSRQAPATEQPQEHSVQSPISAGPADPVPVDLPETQAHSPIPLPPRPPKPLTEGTATSAFHLEPSTPSYPPSEPAEPISDPAVAALTSTHHPDRQETSQSLPIDSWAAPTEHHTPKAPTPSPPTPIATSFGTHQRERLMESPRAPTMSPPTPARGYSSSPDLPLAAAHGQPPPLELVSASEPPHLPGLGQQHLPSTEERTDVEAAPEAAEHSAVEIPHEHNPLDGLVAPKSPHDDNEHKEGEQGPARFPDGEEDLLGSLERSLGK